MNIRPKSPEELQAQAEMFLSTQTNSREAHTTTLEHLRETISEGKEPDKNSLEYQRYVAYLRTLGGMKSEEIQERIAHLQDYAVFADVVAELKTVVASTDDIKSLPSYIGMGNNALAFVVEQSGKKYVVRLRISSDLRNSDKYPSTSSARYYTEMEAGLGVLNLEQVVAFSREDGVTISEYVEGTVGNKLTFEDCEKIPAWQYVDITKTLLNVGALGILIDSKYSNWIYNPQGGFTIIDYQAGIGQGPMIRVGFLLSLLSNSPDTGQEEYTMREPEFYDQIVKGSYQVIELLKHYKEAIEQSNIDAADQLDILDIVNSRIAQNLNVAKQYADPAYIESQIAAEKELFERIKAEHPTWEVE